MTQNSLHIGIGSPYMAGLSPARSVRLLGAQRLPLKKEAARRADGFRNPQQFFLILMAVALLPGEVKKMHACDSYLEGVGGPKRLDKKGISVIRMLTF